MLASHICKCQDELISFKNLTETFEKSKIEFIPTLEMKSNSVAEGDGIGKIRVNMNFLKQLPDPILKPKNRNQHNWSNELDRIYKKEKIPRWASTICSFLAHEIAELMANIKYNKINRPIHH